MSGEMQEKKEKEEKKEKGKRNRGGGENFIRMLPLRKNAFGLEEGEWRSPVGNTVVVRYTKARNRMQCTFWVPYRDARWGREAKAEHQCGMWSEQYRDKCSRHGGRHIERLQEKYGNDAFSGMRSKYKVDILGERGVDGFGDKDLLPLDLGVEIMTLRKLMKYAMQMLEEATAKEGRLPMDHEVKRIADLASRVSGLQMNQLKLEQHRREKGGEAIPVQEVDRMIQDMIRVLQRNVRDPLVMERIVDEFRKVCSRRAEPEDAGGSGNGDTPVQSVG